MLLRGKVHTMKRLFLLTLAITLVAGQAFGFNFNLHDFGSSPFDHNNNWAPISYPSGVGNLPSPGTLGEGGESFDLEGLKVAITDDFVYVAIANSFGYSAYSSAWNQSYDLGDLFIGKDGGGYDYAIDIIDGGSNGLYQVGSSTGLLNQPGSYYGTSIAALIGEYKMTQGTKLGDVTSMETFWADYETNHMNPGNGDTYLYEFAFDRSLLGDFNTLDFHLTLGCGNDLMEESYSPVPEPATMLLFGLGLIGAGIIRRRK